VTVLIKSATLVPVTKNQVPALTLAIQKDETSELSSDKLSDPFVCDGDGMHFAKVRTAICRVPRERVSKPPPPCPCVVRSR